ncbi:MAG: Sec-independent protein translocase protein TatB [Caulobacter sp.]|nr:Sec-independent protein translocase protein TatB [Caulobacter sp.]
MLPEIGATELLLIAAVALIVVGPKDLPVLLRKLGQWMAKARGMANEFRASFDEMARQSELDELRREVQAMRSGQFLDPAGSVGDIGSSTVFGEIESSLQGGEVQFPPSQGSAPPVDEAVPAIAPPAKPRRKRAPARAAPAAAAKTPRTPKTPPKAPPKPRSRGKKTETPT